MWLCLTQRCVKASRLEDCWPPSNHRVWKGNKIINIDSTGLGEAPQGSISEREPSTQGAVQTRTQSLCSRMRMRETHLKAAGMASYCMFLGSGNELFTSSTEGKKNESLPETTLWLVGGECLDRGRLPVEKTTAKKQM